MMVHPILLAVWGVLAACFLGLLLYRGQIERYEDDALFLHQDDSAEEQRQNALVRRIKQLTPLLTVTGGAAGLVTAGVIGLSVYSALQRLH